MKAQYRILKSNLDKYRVEYKLIPTTLIEKIILLIAGNYWQRDLAYKFFDLSPEEYVRQRILIEEERENAIKQKWEVWKTY